MSESLDPYAHYDAGYVMGSLSSQERRDYEEHLKSCVECAAAVGDLAGMPGLLGLVPADEVDIAPPDPEPVPETALPRLVAAARRQRRRRHAWTVAGGAVAAASLAASIVLGVDRIDAAPATAASTTTMTSVRPVPVQATLQLQPVPWGTRVEVFCKYAGKVPPPANVYQRWKYKLMVVPRDGGKPQQVATWGVVPGQDATPSGSTDLTVAQIGTVRLENADGTVLLRATPA
ncbi:MAG: anti-sigma factor family protein [Sciscionella sp.]